MHGGGALVRGIPCRALQHTVIIPISGGVGRKAGVVNMSKSSSGSWWSNLGFGKAAPAPDSDYADMGTAFGLDASLDTLPMPEPGGDSRNEKGRTPSSGAGPFKKR